MFFLTNKQKNANQNYNNIISHLTNGYYQRAEVSVGTGAYIKKCMYKICSFLLSKMTTKPRENLDIPHHVK